MEKLFFLLEQIYRMTHIPINFIDTSGNVTLFVQGYEAPENPLLCDETLRETLIAKIASADTPILEFEDDFLYGACQDLMNNYIILGPVSRKKIGDLQIQSYAQTHHITSTAFQIFFKPQSELNAALSIIYFEITGNYLNEVNIMSGPGMTPAQSNKEGSEYQNYLLDASEQDISRYNFSVEMDFVKQIRNGEPKNVERRMKSNLASFHEESVGKLALRSFKQNEYMACTAIALASRAAIDGGIDSMTSYLMSDLYLQRLEKCQEITDIYRLLPEVILNYAECVRQYKLNHSELSYVEQCKNYVAGHLNKPFTIDDIAQVIGINKSYLSRKFSKSEGMGIQQYAQMKRIQASENMLKFSDESILKISNYLCFASQSHFGKVFKKYNGQTPQKYRERNKMIDFV